jgi:hypothetical protein
MWALAMMLSAAPVFAQQPVEIPFEGTVNFLKLPADINVGETEQRWPVIFIARRCPSWIAALSAAREICMYAFSDVAPCSPTGSPSE